MVPGAHGPSEGGLNEREEVEDDDEEAAESVESDTSCSA